MGRRGFPLVAGLARASSVLQTAARQDARPVRPSLPMQVGWLQAPATFMRSSRIEPVVRLPEV